MQAITERQPHSEMQSFMVHEPPDELKQHPTQSQRFQRRFCRLIPAHEPLSLHRLFLLSVGVGWAGRTGLAEIVRGVHMGFVRT